MKKQRGLKRYYKKTDTENVFNKTIWLNLDNPGIWFDCWHVHFDWKGCGNNSFKRRKPHLDMLFRHFEILAGMTKKLNTDFQLYSILFDFDSYSDALFLHTPNPNNSQFPLKIPGLQLNSTLINKQLNDYLNTMDDYEKLYGRSHEAFCLIFRKDVGHSF